jgi:hypothetical protein
MHIESVTLTAAWVTQDHYRAAHPKRATLLLEVAESSLGFDRDTKGSLDVETVIVDGQVLVEGGRAVRLDEPALLRDVQAEGERLWHALPQWHWSGKTLDEIVPPSHPMREAR